MHHAKFLPVVCEGLFVFGVKRACSGKHDGGVQVSDDARDRAGSRDAGLGTFVTRLKGGQHHGHLIDRTDCVENCTDV